MAAVDSIPNTRRARSTALGIRISLIAAAAVAYLIVPMWRADRGSPVSRFEQLAKAFASGRLTIEIDDARPTLLDVNELIRAADGSGRFYCAYPPLPAVLLLPFVLSGLPVKAALLCRLVSVANVIVMDACLCRMPGALGLPSLRPAARLALAGFFAFGTVAWHNAVMGGDWHLAHAVAVGGLLLGLREFLGPRRPWVVGCFVAVAIAARPTTALTSVFFVLAFMRSPAPDRRSALGGFLIGPCLAVAFLGLYNLARFGSPLNFGYDRMILIGSGADLLARFGQFDLHFVRTNAYWFFAAPPVVLPEGRPPFIGYDPRGLSLFIASPALIYAIVGAVREGKRRKDVFCAVVGIACCLVPLLMYFNTGFWQFGHRFSMDYLPLLMILVVAGAGSRPSRLAYSLIGVSVAIQFVGVVIDPAALPVS